jgi:hypothetical protein
MVHHWTLAERKEIAKAIYGLFIHEAEEVDVYYGPTTVVISVRLKGELNTDGVKKSRVHDFHSYEEE